MASTTALQWMLGASLGLGAIDLIVIDVALAPEVVAGEVVTPRFQPLHASVLATTATEVPRPATQPSPPTPPSQTPPSQTPPSQTPPTPPTSVQKTTRTHVYFGTMSAVLDDTARGALDGLALNGAAVILEGHADERGDDVYNTKLSRKRALAVRQYLVARGAEAARIEVRYTGEVGADDPDLWRDRRVDILITGGPR